MKKRIETSYELDIQEIVDKFNLKGTIKKHYLEGVTLVVVLHETKKKDSIFSMD